MRLGLTLALVKPAVGVGIGFLGAGAILKEGVQIHGLTTAASLWVTSAVGLALGIGNFFAASVTTVAARRSMASRSGRCRWPASPTA